MPLVLVDQPIQECEGQPVRRGQLRRHGAVVPVRPVHDVSDHPAAEDLPEQAVSLANLSICFAELPQAGRSRPTWHAIDPAALITCDLVPLRRQESPPGVFHSYDRGPIILRRTSYPAGLLRYVSSAPLRREREEAHDRLEFFRAELEGRRREEEHVAELAVEH